jgi:hypothetical protein
MDIAHDPMSLVLALKASDGFMAVAMSRVDLQIA